MVGRLGNAAEDLGDEGLDGVGEGRARASLVRQPRPWMGSRTGRGGWRKGEGESRGWREAAEEERGGMLAVES